VIEQPKLDFLFANGLNETLFEHKELLDMPLKAKLFPRYRYSKLPTTESIRLIELHPGEPESRLVCSLITVDLSSQPTYEAISYVWGKPEYSQSIQCNEGTLRITPSLHEALQHFRDTQKCKTLWADALCINQKSEIERGQQITLMDRIFNQAQQVLIWLGHDEQGHGSRVFKLIERANKYFDQKQSFFKSPREEWLSVAEMMKRPWFQRVWVIQEVGCARKAIICFGKVETEWAAFMRLISWLYINVKQRQMSATTSGAIATIGMDIGSVLYSWLSYDTSRDCFGVISTLRQMNPSLLEIVDLARNRKCARAVDHLYAFVGYPLMQLEIRNFHLVPDYGRSLVDVYYEFAVRWMKISTRAHMLSYVAHSTDLTINGEFPTFVPQWHVKNPTEPLNMSSCDHGYNASRSSEFLVRDLGDRLLTVRGVEYIDVAWCSELMLVDQYKDVFRGLSRMALVVWEHIFDKTLSRKRVYDDEELAFALTVTAGRMVNNLTTSETQAIFASFSAYLHKVLRNLEHSNANISERMRKAAQEGDPSVFETIYSRICYNRKFFITKNGYMGIGPNVLQADDTVVVLHGAEVPYVLRPCEDGTWMFVGECYVHGIMNGEIIDMLEEGKLSSRDFILC
jgi:hypothetical protein